MNLGKSHFGACPQDASCSCLKTRWTTLVLTPSSRPIFKMPPSPRLQFQYSRLHSRLNPTPAELGPIRLRACETRGDPLCNAPALELGKYPAHLKHRLGAYAIPRI